MLPMLAARGDRVPTGADWVHEVKWDGVRALVEVSGGALRVWSRRENDVTVTYPEMQGLLGHLPENTVLDGEIVVFENGIPSFAAIADRMNITSAARAAQAAVRLPATLLIFDVLRLDGLEVAGLPWQHRRELLESLELEGPRWMTPPTYDDGPGLYEATRAQGLEGVVSKRRTARYVLGARSDAWLKFPHRFLASYVIGGWHGETDTPSRLGSVLVGVPRGSGLAFRGKVGSGLAGRAGEAMQEVLESIGTATNPFVTPVPREDLPGAHWVDPLLVIDIAAMGLSRELRLRAPSYQRVRTDLDPSDVADDGLG
ncbi:MAG: DNA ligase [Propioniciclava sp.]